MSRKIIAILAALAAIAFAAYMLPRRAGAPDPAARGRLRPRLGMRTGMRSWGGAALAVSVLLAPLPAAAADWAHFHTYRGAGGRTLQYYYDRSAVRTSGGKLLVRQKVVATSPPAGITWYVTEIDCRRATFTEKGTTIVDPRGHATRIPQSQLWVDRPIDPGTSSDKLRKALCR